MPRKNLIRTDEYFYHITTRSNDKKWFQLPLNKVWRISIEAFKKAQKNAPAVISQYVLMSNHYHLLIRTPNADIDKFMYWFNKSFSILLRSNSNSTNRMFGSNYKWSIIRNDRYFRNVFKYIYQNPMRANIVSRCEDYPYSTFHYSKNKIELPFSFRPLAHLENEISYINQSLSNEQILSIKKGLRKTNYTESKAG